MTRTRRHAARDGGTGDPDDLSADGSAITTPVVWFRFETGAFEVVIAEGDPKLDNLRRHERCSLLVFETTPPFRGVAVDGVPRSRRAM